MEENSCSFKLRHLTKVIVQSHLWDKELLTFDQVRFYVFRKPYLCVNKFFNLTKFFPFEGLG